MSNQWIVAGVHKDGRGGSYEAVLSRHATRDEAIAAHAEHVKSCPNWRDHWQPMPGDNREMGQRDLRAAEYNRDLLESLPTGALLRCHVVYGEDKLRR